MKTFSQIVKSVYEYYTFIKDKKKADFNKLPLEEKSKWIDETYAINMSLIEELEARMPVIPNAIDAINTSWVQGYNTGIKEERTKLRGFLHDLKTQTIKEYVELKNSSK